MNHYSCPVCRRVKRFEDLVCAACWNKVPLATEERFQRLKSLGELSFKEFCGEIIAALKDVRHAGKPFGFDVEIECGAMPLRRSFHWRGTEAEVRRKARLQSHFRDVVTVTPLTREQWVAAYGLGRM